MKKQEAKLKQQFKKAEAACKKAKTNEKQIEKELVKLNKKIATLKKKHVLAKAKRKKTCDACTAKKEQLEKLTKQSKITATSKKAKTTKKVAKPKKQALTIQKLIVDKKLKKKRPRSIISMDNLKLIEGIGPKIEEIFHHSGIKSFRDLSSAPIKKLRAILQKAGPRYKMHDPGTWARQAKIAASGDMRKLKKLQEQLKGGRKN